MRVHALHATQTCASNRAAMIRIPTTDECFTLWLPFDVPISAHTAQHGVITFRAAACKENVGERVRLLWGN